MAFDKDTEFYRFKIIEPFLKKQKKLKEISEEKNISYATLKRWVQAYKKNGVIGLEKKTREDKNSFRNVDNTKLNEIKKLCAETNETNITKLYNFYKKKLAADLKISYATFYRIVNNIDHFFNKDTIRYLKKIKKEHQCYILLDIPLYILASDDNIFVPQLLIAIDAATLEPINFMINREIASFYELLGFIHDSILKVSVKENKLVIPQEILVASKEINNKPILKEIFQQLNLKISEHYTENTEIQKFITFITNDIQEQFSNKEIAPKIDEIIEFFTSYLYLNKKEFSFCINYKLVNNLHFIRKLDILLQETNRKVIDSKIRVKNIQYTSFYFSSLNGKTIDIKFSPVINRIIYIFNDKNYLFSAFQTKYK